MMARVKRFSATLSPLPQRTEGHRVRGKAFGRLPKNDRKFQSQIITVALAFSDTINDTKQEVSKIEEYPQHPTGLSCKR